MSTRGAARSLMERRTERFECARAPAECESRLSSALQRAGPQSAVAFTTRWIDADGKRVLEADFAPARSTLRILRMLSLSLALLLAASAWAIFSSQPSAALRWLLPITTLLAVLGVPIATHGLASQREAAEAQLRKAIRAALAADSG